MEVFIKILIIILLGISFGIYFGWTVKDEIIDNEELSKPKKIFETVIFSLLFIMTMSSLIWILS